MSTRNSVLKFIYCVQAMGLVYGLYIENHYIKNIYTFGDDRQNSSNLFDLSEEMRQEKYEAKLKDQIIFDIRLSNLPEKCQSLEFPSNCAEATACTKRSGIYKIRIPQYSNETFLVECNSHDMGGDWTVIQRRQDGSTDFYRTWSDYKEGFGKLDNEFFIGLDKLYALTNYHGAQELLILMENANDSKMDSYALYSSFLIGNEEEKFLLKQTGRYSGTAGDSLKRHIGYKFTTKDQDNDVYAENCARLYIGGWWYDKCHQSNLNGHYGDVEYAKGITWVTLTGYHTSLPFVQMMIRPRRKLIKFV